MVFFVIFVCISLQKRNIPRMRNIFLSALFVGSFTLSSGYGYAASDAEIAKALSVMIHKHFDCRDSGGMINPPIWCYTGTVGTSVAGGKDIVLTKRASSTDPLKIIKALDLLGADLGKLLDLYEKGASVTIEEFMTRDTNPLTRKLLKNYQKLLGK